MDEGDHMGHSLKRLSIERFFNGSFAYVDRRDHDFGARRR